MTKLSTCLDKLRTYRDNNERKSREVLDLWTECVKFNLNNLGKEKHLILEQVCVAALDTFDIYTARKCIALLHYEFPNSLRVKKYDAMRYEAEEDYDTALKILESIIKVEETNSAARKRIVAIYKAQGKNSAAIKELCDYLKIFMADMEAWQELSELYLAEQDYNKAAFCIEELILHNPHNHLLHQRYADIRYTQGGLENLELARAYYSQAINLNDKSLRALYGLYMTTTAIAASSKCTTQKKKEALKTSDWVLKAIKAHYESYSNEDLSDVENKLQALSFN